MRYFKLVMLMSVVFVTSCFYSGDGAVVTESDALNTSKGDATDAVVGTTAGVAASEESGNVVDVKLNKGDVVAKISLKDYGTITFKLFPKVAPVGVQNFIELAEGGYYKGKNVHRVIKDFMIQGGSLNGNGTGGTAANGEGFDIETSLTMRNFYGALCYANSGTKGGNTCQFYVVNSKVGVNYNDFDLETITNNANFYAEKASSYSDSESESDRKAKDYYLELQKYYENMGYFVRTATDEVRKKYNEEGGAPLLDGNYTVFGQAVEGLDVLDKVSAVETQSNGNVTEEISVPVTEIIISDVVIETVS